jgi:hypothetical protein
MKRRFSERRIVGALVALLGLEVLLLLLHLGVLSVHSAHSTSGVIAGRIVKSQNELRRRDVNSLVWEKTAVDEPLYFHDSVLTLSQSTATLELEPHTQITLSENTLVTIEPPDQREHGEIRLKFMKGNLQARNPYGQARVEGGEWTVALRPGSDVEFRQTGERNFEMQVLQGEAVFKNEASESKVTPEALLRISGQNAVPVTMDSELSWVSPPPARIYTHDETVGLSVHWQGEVSHLVVQTLGQGEREIEIHGHEARLDLPLGQHKLYLREGGRSSTAMSVQVWRAPQIQLLRPLPRDRVRVGADTEFMWTRVPGIDKFNLDLDSFGRREAGDNSLRVRFDHAGDGQWTVRGVDHDGYEIPPLYSDPIFVRENPLAAPRLRTPQLRQPASHKDDRGASFRWLWQQLFPEAAAEEAGEFEALFEWDPVEGADQYAVEVSTTRDFRQPVLMKTVHRPSFVWRGFAPKAYYWRVAAGTKAGRMGVFSEAALIHLDQPSVAANEGVVLRRVEPAVAAKTPPAPEPTPPPPVVATPSPPAAPPVVEKKRPVAKKSLSPFVAWKPSVISSHVVASDHVKGQFSGTTAQAVMLELPWMANEDRLWIFNAEWTAAKFRPSPAATYPFQPNVNWQDARLSALCFQSWWGYGAEMRELFTLERTGLESVRAQTDPAAGPALATLIRHGRWQFGSQAALAIGGQSAFTVSAEVRFELWRGVNIGFSGAEQIQFTGTTQSVGSGVLGFGF